MIAETETIAVKEGRIRSVDVLRGVALVFMVINHFGQTFVGGGYHSPIAAAILFFGIIPAPLFYIIAGMSIALSNYQFYQKGASTQSIWRWVLSRGILIMGLGYLFSVSMFGTVWWLDWSILQLIGFSLIVCQIALLIPWRYRILLPAFFIILAPFLRIWLNYDFVVGTVGNIHYSPPLTFLDHLSAMLATGKAPLFPWLACPLIGTIIGDAIIQYPNTPHPIVYSSLFAGSLMCISVLPLFISFGDTVTQYPLTNGFFLLATGMSLLTVASVITSIDIWRWWSKFGQFFEVNGQITLISYLSHHFYGIILLGVLLGLYRSLEIFGLSLIIISYFLLSFLFAYFWLPFRKKRSSYWDIVASYLILITALVGRWILAAQGYWAF